MRRAAAAALLLGLVAAGQDAPAPGASRPASRPEAQPAAEAEDEGPPVPPTRLGVELLARAPLVVVARTIATRPAAIGTELVRVRVLERMLGARAAPGDELSLLVPAGQFLFGHEDLLFLAPYGDGGRHEVLERISATDKHYDAKLSITRRSVWLMEIPDAEQRNDATLALLFDLLRSRDAWTRRHALDELAWMAGARAALFTASRRARLLAAGRVSPHEEVSRGVENVARTLQAGDDRLREDAEKEQSRP